GRDVPSEARVPETEAGWPQDQLQVAGSARTRHVQRSVGPQRRQGHGRLDLIVWFGSEVLQTRMVSQSRSEEAPQSSRQDPVLQVSPRGRFIVRERSRQSRVGDQRAWIYVDDPGCG